MRVAPHVTAMVIRLVGAPAWLRGLVLLLFGAAVAGLCWWLVLQDLQQSTRAKSPAKQVEQGRLEALQTAVENAQAQQALVAQQKQQLAKLESTLPAGDDAQGAWSAVHEASRRHGLRMEQFKPGPIGTETPYPQQRAALRLTGNFDALLAFTHTLAEARSPVGIESYVLASQASQGVAGGGSLVLEATLLSLHRPAANAEPAAALAAKASTIASRPTFEGQGPVGGNPVNNEAPARAQAAFAWLPSTPGDPFESQRLATWPASTVVANALTSFPLSAMRMVGSVRAADPKAGLTALVLIGGALHPARVGDPLGNARGRVSEIRSDGLTVLESGSLSLPSLPGAKGSPGAAQSARSVTLLVPKD